jgi:hypothetical protein
VTEIVSPVTGRADDLNWTIERLYELAREQKSTELIRVLKQSVWARALPQTADEPTIGPRKATETNTESLS